MQAIPAQVEEIERMLGLEQRFFLGDHNLIYTDKMSMASGVEVRVPLLDVEVLKHSQRIPAKYKIRGNEAKWIFKKVMEPYLPKNIIYRPKTGFSLPLRRWLRFELREYLAEYLSVERLKTRGLFDAGAVQGLIKLNDKGAVDASYTLFSILCIEIWCEKFIDGKKL